MARVPFLKYILKYIAMGGYVAVYLLSSYTLEHLPIFVIASGITFLSMFRTPLSDYVFNWSLYSLLVYMLITYHEMDGCVLEECEQSKTAAFISIVSTIISWTSISDRRTKENQPEVPEAVNETNYDPLYFKAKATFPKLHWV